ncbi:MAG TPA: hypothetical protein ENH98_00895 [archaeon]|nr:hypothetical protein [archaeon]
MNKRLDDYKNLLNSIYGEEVTDFLTKISNGKELQLISFKDNLKEFLDFKRDTSTDCNECIKKKKYIPQELKKTTFFKNKIMEFPCWHTDHPLDFSKDSVKKYMIIGKDPGPDIRSDIHSAYELNLFDLDKEQNNIMDEFKEIVKNPSYIDYTIHSNSSKGAKLFPYLKNLFLDKYDNLLKSLYITDVCKCLFGYEGENKGRDVAVRNFCFQECGIKEIEIIKPKLIIFQGDDGCESFSKFAKKREEIKIDNKKEIVNKYFDQNIQDMGIKNRMFGHISINGQQIKFIKIYHSSKLNYPTEKRKISLKAYQKLIQNEINI